MRAESIDTLLGGYLPLSGGTMNKDANITLCSTIDNRITTVHFYGMTVEARKDGNGYISGLIATGEPEFEKYPEGLSCIAVLAGGSKTRYYYGGPYNAPLTIQTLDGKWGFGTTDPKHKIHVVGDIYCTGKIITDGGLENRGG